MYFGPPLVVNSYSLFIITAVSQFTNPFCGWALGSLQRVLLWTVTLYERSGVTYLVSTWTHVCWAHTQAWSRSVLRCTQSASGDTASFPVFTPIHTPTSWVGRFWLLISAQTLSTFHLFAFISLFFSFLVLNNFLVYNLCRINCTLLKCKTQWVWKMYTHTHGELPP